MTRKHISDKTRLAATLLARGEVPYTDAKKMSEDQLISLYHWDHNILHESGHADRDKFWNLAPMLIKAHREKTRADAKIIAKSRRIRAWNDRSKDSAGAGNHVARLRSAPLRIGSDEEGGEHSRRRSIRHSSEPHKLRSRGFDKRYRKKLDGTVVKRAGD